MRLYLKILLKVLLYDREGLIRLNVYWLNTTIGYYDVEEHVVSDELVADKVVIVTHTDMVKSLPFGKKLTFYGNYHTYFVIGPS